METELQRRVAQKLEAAGEKAAPLAKRLGLSDSFIRDILRGKTKSPSAANLERLARSLGTTADYLLGITDDDEPGEPTTIEVPIITWVNAGAMMRDDISDEALGNIAVSDLPPGDWIALRVVGTSMDRISPPDSTIIVNRKDRKLIPNGLYVIADLDGNATYKRYRPGPPMRFEPVSTDTHYEPLFPTREPVIVGRVRRSILDT